MGRTRGSLGLSRLLGGGASPGGGNFLPMGDFWGERKGAEMVYFLCVVALFYLLYTLCFYKKYTLSCGGDTEKP